MRSIRSWTRPLGRLLSLLGSLALCAHASAQGRGSDAFLSASSCRPDLAREVEAFVRRGGGRIVHSFGGCVFIGSVPPGLDAQLSSRFSVQVRRGGPVEPSSLQGLGETATAAADFWNRSIVDSGLPAPSPTAAGAFRAQAARGRGDRTSMLEWPEVAGATHYRLQIGSTPDLAAPRIDTTLDATAYALRAPFFPEGLYYWRVKALDLIDEAQGRTRESAWSQPESVQVSAEAGPRRPGRRPAPGKDAVPLKRALRGKAALEWPRAPGETLYRIQISTSPAFETTVIDQVVDSPRYKTSSSALRLGATYYWRVMASDGESEGEWSAPGLLQVESPGPVPSDMRWPRRKP